MTSEMESRQARCRDTNFPRSMKMDRNHGIDGSKRNNFFLKEIVPERSLPLSTINRMVTSWRRDIIENKQNGPYDLPVQIMTMLSDESQVSLHHSQCAQSLYLSLPWRLLSGSEPVCCLESRTPAQCKESPGGRYRYNSNVRPGKKRKTCKCKAS